MKTILNYFVFIIFHISFNDAAQFRCDYTYFPEAGGWFKLHRTPTSWDEASKICGLEGAVLAAPLSVAAENAMKTLMNPFFEVTSSAVHTGIATERYNHFKRLDKLKKGLAWIMMFNSTITSAKKETWYPYICFRSGGEFVSMNNCGTIDNDYIVDSRTGSCYKFHRRQTTWYDGLFICSLEGAHLVVINDDVEAQVIIDIFNRNPPSSLPYDGWNSAAFVGFSQRPNGKWMTFDGQTIDEAGFSRFGPGEPNNAKNDEFCGSVGRDGLLQDNPCHRIMSFICEKRPDSLTRCNYQVSRAQSRRTGNRHVQSNNDYNF